MLKRVLLAQTIEMFFSLTGECGGTTGAWTIHQARRALVRKAMDPRAPGGIGKLERVGDGVQALPLHDVAHGLGTAEDAGCLRLLSESV